MKFNVNDYAFVKLTDEGKKILKENHERFIADLPKHVQEKYPFILNLDKNGYYRAQLWCLFSDFGPHMTVGSNPPFETEIELEIKK